MGRATQGVKLINLRDDDTIASIARVPKEEESENGIVKNTESDESPAEGLEFKKNDSLNSSEQESNENKEDINTEETI